MIRTIKNPPSHLKGTYPKRFYRDAVKGKTPMVKIPIGTIKNVSTGQEIEITASPQYTAIIRIKKGKAEETHFWLKDKYDGNDIKITKDMQ